MVNIKIYNDTAVKTNKNKRPKRKINYGISRFFYTIPFGLIVGCGFNTNALAEQPRAKIVIDADKETTELIKGAIGSVATAPQSAYEARKRGEVAAEDAIEALRSLGYYQAQIVIDVSDDEVTEPILKIEKGTQFKIKDPAITWSDQQPDNKSMYDASSAIGLKNGDPGLSSSIIEGESRALGSILHDGYADAALGQREVIVDHADYSVHPTYNINAGEKAIFGNLVITGKTRTKSKWLNRIRPWKYGETYSPDKISQMEKLLLETGAFDAVNLRLGEKGADKARDIILTLEDRAKTSVEIEGSYSTTEGISGETRFNRYNIMGRGDSFINRILLGQIESRIESKLKLPHYRKPNQTLSLSVGAFRDDTDAYRETGMDVRAEVMKKFKETSYWSAGVLANYANTREPSLNTLTYITRDYWLLGAVSTYLLDKTDNTLNPRKGYKADASLEPSYIISDKNLGYLKMSAQASYYKNIDKDYNTIFATRARFAAIAGGSLAEIPSARRLYAGGGGSVRGYEYQGIGPRYADADKTPMGGLSLIEVSAELRHQFQNKFGVAAFVDAGTLSKTSTPSFSDVSIGVGVGLRYDLGFAPVRIDFAIPVDKPVNDASFQIYIGVGQSF